MWGTGAEALVKWFPHTRAPRRAAREKESSERSEVITFRKHVDNGHGGSLRCPGPEPYWPGEDSVRSKV